MSKYNNFKSHSVIVLTKKIFDNMIFLLITTTGGRTILFSVCNGTISISISNQRYFNFWLGHDRINLKLIMSCWQVYIHIPHRWCNG